jgi:hypothetical protein
MQMQILVALQFVLFDVVKIYLQHTVANCDDVTVGTISNAHKYRDD